MHWWALHQSTAGRPQCSSLWICSLHLPIFVLSLFLVLNDWLLHSEFCYATAQADHFCVLALLVILHQIYVDEVLLGLALSYTHQYKPLLCAGINPKTAVAVGYMQCLIPCVSFCWSVLLATRGFWWPAHYCWWLGQRWRTWGWPSCGGHINW